MSPVRLCAAFALVLAVSALSAFAATPVSRTLDPAGGAFAIDNVVDRSNVFVYGTVAEKVTLTFTINGVKFEESSNDANRISISLGGLLWCKSDSVAGNSLTIEYSATTTGGTLYTLVSDPELVLDGKKSASLPVDVPSCGFTSSKAELRDIYVAIADVEKDSHFQVKLAASGFKIRNVYADDDVCPGTDCPQKNDFTKDRCPFAARSEGSATSHEINSLWSPEGLWWFRVQPDSTTGACDATTNTIRLSFSDAFTAKVSAALVAVLAVAAMFF